MQMVGIKNKNKRLRFPRLFLLFLLTDNEDKV